MPKMKTRRSAAKRFKFTATKKIKRAQAFKGHLLGHKTAKRKRQLRRHCSSTSATDYERVRKMLPYA
jgi:large subunit ribosomal protein L35